MLKKCQFKDMIRACLAGRFKDVHGYLKQKEERHVTKKGVKVESTFVQNYELRNFSAILPV